MAGAAAEPEGKVRRLALAAVALLALAFVAAASARDPRDEKLRLNAADTKAARAALLTVRDLQSGFQRKKPSGDSPLTCPGYRPDFSKYTITGKAESNFQHPAGAWVTSGVEIYATHVDATGDFRLGAKPQVATCLKQVLEKQDDPTVTVKVLRSKRLAAPPLGERAARYSAVVRFAGPARTLNMYLDLYAFQKGRLVGFVITMSVSQPIRDGANMARLMLSRA